MELSKERLERLRELLAPAHQQIVIVSHTNPDGDAGKPGWYGVRQVVFHSKREAGPNGQAMVAAVRDYVKETEQEQAAAAAALPARLLLRGALERRIDALRARARAVISFFMVSF